MEKIHKSEQKQLLTLLLIVLVTFVALSPIPIGKAAVTLTVLTRHASDITGIFETEFLKTDLAIDAGIIDITFKAPAAGFWPSQIGAGGIDVAWGGGPTLFDSLADENLLLNMSASPAVMEEVNAIPDTFAGAPQKRLKEGKLVWVAAAVSSFGFTVNEDTRSLFELPTPAKWDDLADPSYFREPQMVGVVNAPESTSNTRAYEIMLQGFGWETGWQIVTLMSANSRIYHGSTESLGAVVGGEVAVALTIDFYGIGAQIQNPECEYIIPEGQSIVNGDPIALTVNAAHPAAAEAFVKYVLSKEGQSQWLRTELNRLPVREDAFDTPLGQQRPDLLELYTETMDQTGIEFDDALSLSLMNSVIYYYEATINNAHAELVDAWERVMDLYDVDSTAFEALSRELGRPLITMEEAMAINDQMGSNPAFRAQKQSEWYSQAVDKYDNVPTGVVNAFSVDWEGVTYDVDAFCNSIVTDFSFSQPNKQISFNVAGASGTTGSCTITIPDDLLGGEFSVYMDGDPLVKDVDYTQTHNGTHYIFVISYMHTTHLIEVRGTEVVPEFPTWIPVLLILMLLTAAIVIYKQRLFKTTTAPAQSSSL
jgi:ABC-type Fe3+ transport system substrate-binding protein